MKAALILILIFLAVVAVMSVVCYFLVKWVVIGKDTKVRW